MNNIDKPVIILGAGGHAKVVAQMLAQSGKDIIGFVTPDEEPNSRFCGFNVLGDDNAIANYPPNTVVLANGIGSLPNQDLRWLLAKKMREQQYVFATIIHPTAIVAYDVKLADGVQIMAGSVIQPGTQIGRDAIINTGVLLDHDCNVEPNCHLAPGVVCSGNVTIGKNVHIGTGTTIIQNITIGKKAVIAAGSTIYKDIPCDVKFMQLCKNQVIKNTKYE